MKSIVLVLPYFGSFPNYFSFWIKSIEKNPTVDFLLLTDCTQSMHLPSNVKVVNTSFLEVRRKVEMCFDFPVVLDTPYKLCDYKPAYGLIFKEYLAKYDFWGHCDCDLIFGNIRHFVTEDILEKYDRILEYGHLSIYKNCDRVNTMFMQHVAGVRYYRNVYQSSKIQCFDEMCGVTPIWRSISPERVYQEVVFDDIDPMRKNFYLSFGGSEPYVYQYDCGRLIRLSYDPVADKVMEQERLYVHFQKRTMKVKNNGTMNSFIIVPNSFLQWQALSGREVQKWTHVGGLYLKPMAIKWNAIKKKVVNRLLGVK